MNDEQLQNEATPDGPAMPQVEVHAGMDASLSEASLLATATTDPANIDAMDELFAELLSEQDPSDFESSAAEAASIEAAAPAEPELHDAPAVAVVAEPEAAPVALETTEPEAAIDPVTEVPLAAEVPVVAQEPEVPEEPAVPETVQLEYAASSVEPDAPPIPGASAEPAEISLETASLLEPEALEVDEPASLDWLEADPEASVEAAPSPASSTIEDPAQPTEPAALADFTEPDTAAGESGFDAAGLMLEELLAAEQDFGAAGPSQHTAADPAETTVAGQFAPSIKFATLAGPRADLEDEQPERTSPPLDDLIRGIDAQLEAVAPAAAPVEQPAVTHKQFSQLDDYVVFTLSGGDYALPVRDVAEIGRVPTVTKVPNVPEFVRGITNLRGEIVPVLNLPQLLGLQETAPTARGRVLFLQARDQVAASGLLVDEVKGIQRIPSQQLEHVTGLVDDKVTSVLRGVHGRGDRLLNVLDLEQVFRLEEFQKFERR